jgi:uncharacterized protein
LSAQQIKPITIWRITDGKAGHDAQSLGLVTAIARLTPSRIHTIETPPPTGAMLGLLTRKFRAGDTLPAPDLIVGAGQSTHLPMLCARHARGGRAIVLMRPSLPTAWFDLCFIPEHDRPRHSANIQSTRGALNTIVPSQDKDPHKGLILIGGPSRHYLWDEHALLSQIRRIIEDASVHWQITDSARTPDSTRRALSALAFSNLLYIPCAATGPGWVSKQLMDASITWVTEDSVSMLYEALTSGSAVGVLHIPAIKSSRLVAATSQLTKDKLVVRFDDWANGQDLTTTQAGLNEADRCAQLVLQHFCLPCSNSPGQACVN